MTLAELATEVAAGIAECPDFVALKQVQRATAELMDKCRLCAGRCHFNTPAWCRYRTGRSWLGSSRSRSTAACTRQRSLETSMIRSARGILDGTRRPAAGAEEKQLVWVDAIAYLSPLPGVELPDGMLNRKVCDAIQNGARHYLFQVPSQPCTQCSPPILRRAVHRGMHPAAKPADRGFVDSRCRTKPHFF
ncbi:hypothetical protein [Chromobacterium phragmitis]|uniref:hypothetical protein n=1 Tax=Chromobacterium phragmitis TaxID=2202141 RepID=UPI0011AE4ED8|nr:hypothetical protein [Chromobacterium phragmitis]